MTIETIRLAVAALAIASTPAAAVERQTKHVTIDGAKFRVTVEGERVEVAHKAFFTALTMDQRDRMRRAVQQATGCKVIDEFPNFDGRLQGKLDCAKPD